MTYTSHGHHILGSPMEEEPPEARTRCGGPALCTICSKEAAAYKQLPEALKEVTDSIRET